MNFSLWLLGGALLRADAANRVDVLNACLTEGVSFSELSWNGDGSICFRCSFATARSLLRRCHARGISLTCERVDGFPAIAWHLRRRLGLVVGMACAIAMIVLSGLFVWDVSVTGNETIPEQEIEALLSECGFGVGSYLPDVRAREIENRVLISSDRLSWISVNLDGTVAHVQVIERIAAEDERDRPKQPANLVAACDGQIELIQLYRGESTVKIGQAVKKGELLASGILGSETEGLRFTRAAGEVLARTEREILVEIPLCYPEKSVGEEKIQSATLNFFNFSLKIFKSTGNDGEQCDIIEKVKELPTFGARPLPLSVSLRISSPYTMQTKTRSAKQALELAYSDLDEQLRTLSNAAQILEKRVTTEITDTAVLLRATVTCIENIARTQEFAVE